MCSEWVSTTLSEETSYSGPGGRWSEPILAAYLALNATLGEGYGVRLEVQQILSEEQDAEATNYMLGAVFTW